MIGQRPVRLTGGARPKMLQPAEHVRIPPQIVWPANFRESLCEVTNEEPRGQVVVPRSGASQGGGQQPHAGLERCFQRRGAFHFSGGCGSFAICSTARLYSVNT